MWIFRLWQNLVYVRVYFWQIQHKIFEKPQKSNHLYATATFFGPKSGFCRQVWLYYTKFVQYLHICNTWLVAMLEYCNTCIFAILAQLQYLHICKTCFLLFNICQTGKVTSKLKNGIPLNLQMHSQFDTALLNLQK